MDKCANVSAETGTSMDFTYCVGLCPNCPQPALLRRVRNGPEIAREHRGLLRNYSEFADGIAAHTLRYGTHKSGRQIRFSRLPNRGKRLRSRPLPIRNPSPTSAAQVFPHRLFYIRRQIGRIGVMIGWLGWNLRTILLTGPPKELVEELKHNTHA